MVAFGQRWRGPAIALVVVLALTGCARSGSGAAAAAPATGSGGAATSSGAPGGGATGGGGGTGAAGVDTGSALARGSFHPPNAPEATVDVAVLALKDDGNGKTMTLQVAFTPRGMPPSFGNGMISVWDMLNRDSIGPHLLDRAHLKRYDVIRSVTGKQLCSDLVLTQARDGGTALWTGTYALPQDQITSVEVWVSAAYPPLTNVPIQR